MRANLTVLFFPARLGLRWADGGPDVVRLFPLALVPSSAGTTSPGSKGPEAGPAWCLPPRNPLFLRRRTPRPPNNWARRRDGRGASLPASPYFFVDEHHVPRTIGADGGPDMVPPSPLALIPSSPSTTSPEQLGPTAGRTWCLTPRNPLFLRRRAPRPLSLRGPGPTACRDKKSRQPQVTLGLPPSPPIRKYPPLHSSRRVFPSLFSLASAAV